MESFYGEDVEDKRLHLKKCENVVKPKEKGD